jgi:sarcosine oxidase subunit alpha
MSFRIHQHPVLEFAQDKKPVAFFFENQRIEGYEGEPIIVALRAAGVVALKEGAKQHTPFGPFCMQGRCCSCAMTVDGKPNVMTCVTPLKEGMKVQRQDAKKAREAYRSLPQQKDEFDPAAEEKSHPQYDLAVIGAGPAGLEAALAARQAGVERVIVFDDKAYLGGQLKLQTHTFFGNQSLGASLRGFEIAEQMENEAHQRNLDIRLSSTVVGLYPKGVIGYRDHQGLSFVRAKKVICATGASEKFLSFPGNTLPGVMGAGGAQTFMNIYGVRPGRQVVIIGGGNIGVILAYQLIQAGVLVAAIVEAGPRMGAYEVHVNKIKALGVPVFTSHTIVKAHGQDKVEGATLAQLGSQGKIVPGTEKYFAADTICLAVGLSPLSELLWQIGCEFTLASGLGEVVKFDENRRTTHPDIYVAGDCAVIGEASIARLEGRIAGLAASAALGQRHPEHDQKMKEANLLLSRIQSGSLGAKLGAGKAEVMSTTYQDHFVSKPYRQQLLANDFHDREKRIVMRCQQDIPCNPCEASCKKGAIKIGDELNQQPSFDPALCTGCGNCLTACPGRAIRMVQYHYSPAHAVVTVAYEFADKLAVDDAVNLIDDDFKPIGKGNIVKIRTTHKKGGCSLVSVLVEKELALAVRGFTALKNDQPSSQLKQEGCGCSTALSGAAPSRNYVCRCEEVTYEDIVEAIGKGYTTLNELKRLKRVGMGQCRGQSCTAVIEGILMRELGRNRKEILYSKIERASVFRPPLKRITLAEAARLSFSTEEMALFGQVDEEHTLPLAYSEKQPETPASQPAQEDSAEVVIIGGGITGIMTAWWLARLGMKDVVVFERSFNGSGQTGACLGGIRTGFNTTNKIKRAIKGLEVYRDAKELIGDDVGWYQGGYVYLAFDRQQDQLFRSSFDAWHEADVPFEYVTDRSRFDHFVPGMDADKLTSLIHFPEAGGANPFRAMFAFAEDAKRQGVRFYNNHEVSQIELGHNRVRGVVVEDRHTGKTIKVKATHVVNCAGTSSVKIAGLVGLDLRDQIWIERHGAFITEKMPLWLKPLVVSYHPELSGYWQQKRMEAGVDEGEIVACYSESQIIKGFNKESTLYFLSRMAKAMLLCQPALADVGIVRNFAEHYVGRKSGVPMIGETPIKGFWLNIAKKGHGFMCAPGDGYALASSIVEGREHEWIAECKIHEDMAHAETMK